MATFVLIQIIGGYHYVLFGEYETMAFISAVFVTLLVATAERNNLQLSTSRLATLLVITVFFIVFRFVVPGRDLVVGPIIALLAWILLLMAAGLFTMPSQNKETQGDH